MYSVHPYIDHTFKLIKLESQVPEKVWSIRASLESDR